MSRRSILIGALVIAVIGALAVSARLGNGGSDRDDAASSGTSTADSPVAAPTTTGVDATTTAATAEPPEAPGDSQSATTSPPATDPPSSATTTTTTTVPRPRTTADGTPDEPVPPGEVFEFTGVWDIVVTGVDLDAADYVTSLNDINPDPPPGYRYVLIELAGTYLGDRTAEPVFEWAVSDGVDVFEPSIPGCGVIPDWLYDVREVVPGESFIGALCLPVPEESVGRGLELSLQLGDDPPKFFQLTP